MAFTENKLIVIENTKFIFMTNFSGDPERDRFNSPERKANIIIPDVDQARELKDAGINVKLTRPKEGEEEGFVPRYYVPIKVNYRVEWDRLKPKVYLTNSKMREPVLLDETSIDTLDKIDIANVNVTLNPREWSRNNDSGVTLWVRTMYVEQDIEEDPFADRYRRNFDEE